MVPPVFFRSCVLVMSARGGSPAVAASTPGDSLDAAEHPHVQGFILTTSLSAIAERALLALGCWEGSPCLCDCLPLCCSDSEGSGLAATGRLPISRTLLSSPLTQAHPVLLVPSQVLHYRKRVLLLAPADITIEGFILSSDLTSSFLKLSL